MLPAVRFASCYVYSPAGTCAVSERSRLLRALLKSGDARFMPKYALRVRQQSVDVPFLSGFFDATDVLVPVPGNTASVAGATCVAERLAEAFVKEGLGRLAWTGLRRVRAVRKSATARAGRRPTVGNHYDSFAIEQVTVVPERIVLIDDVVTKGRTLLAAATRLNEAFPAAQIRAFALVRTMGLIQDVPRLLEPCCGDIRWRGGDAHRNP